MTYRDPVKYAEYQRAYHSNPDNRRRAVVRAAQYAEKNPEAVAVTKRRFHLARQYQLTLAEYEQMAKDQGHKCLICEVEDWAALRGKLYVDHDHKTGQVRGLLCHHCNVALGNLRDDPELLKRALRYLEKTA